MKVGGPADFELQRVLIAVGWRPSLDLDAICDLPRSMYSCCSLTEVCYNLTYLIVSSIRLTM
jgi:hypothetical protein